MEKRLVLAFALTIIVFLVFQHFQQRDLNQTSKTNPAVQTQAQKEKPPTPAPPITAEDISQSAKTSLTDTSAGNQSVVVAGELYRAVIDNQGAVLVSWELNNYKSAQGKSKSAEEKIFEMIAANHGGDSKYLRVQNI